MRERIQIVDMTDGSQAVTLDFQRLTDDELSRYVLLGYAEAIDEMLRRDPRAGLEIDPNAPVTLPEL
jgi:hypothetical protein